MIINRNRFIDRNGRRDSRHTSPGQVYDIQAGSAYKGVMSQKPSAAKTAKKRSSRRTYTHALIEVGGRGVALLCALPLFPRPPPDCEM